MREIYEILPATGMMTAADILPRVGPGIQTLAYERREPLTAAVLRKSMAMTAANGWHFTGGKEGRFGRGELPKPTRSRVAG